MEQDPATVYVVDDDASIRRALGRLLRSAGLNPIVLDSIQELLALSDIGGKCCVLADVRMSGISGLELPELLMERGWKMPVIFLTAQDTETTRSAAHRAGAAGFFRKPVDDQALIDMIKWVLSNGAPPITQKYV
jgi:FixJ family two-component response regulator